MKVSLNWLKDFVDIKVNPKALAQKLTMAGLEVGSVEKYQDDFVLEMEITANRPDCLSILGIAQEVAAITGNKLQTTNYKLQTTKKRFLKTNFITIQNTKDCAFYRGCLIRGVEVKASPDWLGKRLEAVGVRPVNNIVDITNYCLLEYGQPLHAFDYSKINEQIIVRRAKNKEKILTIDGKERELDEDVLVISDKNKAIAIAGIMGDKLSEVSAQTTDVMLESAYFNPLLIRRASRKMGLSTDSSYRFERQVDWQRVRQAQDKAVYLICKLSGGKYADEKVAGITPRSRVGNIRQEKDRTDTPHVSAGREIIFDCAKANRILSLTLSSDKIKNIFSLLGFSCKKSGKDKLLVKIPAIRRDIKIQEDLTEELARIYGYDKIVATVPAMRSALIKNSESETIKSGLREIICGLGFSEAINYSLLSKLMLDAAGLKKEALHLRNPLSSEQEYLRPSLLPGLLNSLAYNLNHKNVDLKLFELGHIFNADSSEEMVLGIIATGKHIDTWQVKKEFDFFSLKGVTQNILEHLGFGLAEFLLTQDNSTFSNAEATKILCQGKEIGIQGRIDNRILLNFGIKNAGPVFYAEILIKDLLSCKSNPRKFSALPVYPSMVRDLSIAVNKSVEYSDIVTLIEKEAAGYLNNIKLVDVYKGEQIAAGCVGMTISLEFGLSDRTLTDEEVTQIHNRITKSLKQELSIQIR
jgi:phenylalanyl-tRNA synthetase beta chain